MSTRRAKSSPAVPDCFAKMQDIGRECLWDEAMSALLVAGFVLRSSRRWHERDWNGVEPLSQAPDPAYLEKFREFALFDHSEGFVVQMDSTQGGYKKKPGEFGFWSGYRRDHADFDPHLQKLNSCCLYYQVDLGAGGDECGFMIGNRQKIDGQMDGTYRMFGHGDCVTGSNSMLSMIGQVYSQGKPVALSLWQRDFFYVPTQAYSDAPHSYIASESDRIKKVFAARFKRDFKVWILSLPEELALVVDLEAAVLELPSSMNRVRSCISDDFAHYAAGLFLAKDLRYPSGGQKAKVKACCVEMEKKWLWGGGGWQKDSWLDLGDLEELDAGFCTPLHALSCLTQRGAQWVQALDGFFDRRKQQAQSWIRHPDAKGSVPWELAWDTLMREPFSMDGPIEETALGWHISQGWVENGELCAKIFKELGIDPNGPRENYAKLVENQSSLKRWSWRSEHVIKVVASSLELMHKTQGAFACAAGGVSKEACAMALYQLASLRGKGSKEADTAWMLALAEQYALKEAAGRSVEKKAPKSL